MTRATDVQILASVLNGREATLRLQHEEEIGEGKATLELDNRTSNAQEVVLRQGSTIVQIPTEHQAELFALTEMGLPLEVQVRSEEGFSTVSVRLGEF